MTRYDFYGNSTVSGLSIVSKNNKFGVYNSLDNIEILPLIYDEIVILCNNLFAVNIQGGWGVVDENNKIFVPIKFKRVDDFCDKYLLIQDHSGMFFLMCKITKKVSKEYTKIYNFENGYAFVANNTTLGVIDENLEEIISPIHNAIMHFKDDMFFTIDSFNHHLLTLRILKSSNVLITTLPYLSIFKLYNNSPYYIVKQNDLYGLIDMDLKQVVPVKYYYINYLFEDFIKIVISEGSTRYYGIFCLSKGQIIDPKYKSINSIGNCLFGVENFDKKLALFDTNGKQLTDFIYDQLCLTGCYVSCFIKDHNRPYECLIGLLDNTGKQLINPVYDGIYSKGHGYVVSKGTKCGICDSKANLVSDVIFDRVYNINEYNKTGRRFAEVRYKGIDGTFVW